MKTFYIYMMCGGETGDPYFHKEYESTIEATNEEDAFSKWLNIHGYKEIDFMKLDKCTWKNYYLVHCEEIN